MKTVYSIMDEGPLFAQILEENGYKLVVGNGTPDDDLLAQCDALVPGKAKITPALLDKAPKLKLVSKFGVGVDKIDIPACTERGILVCNTRFSNYVSVAEHTMTLILSAAKNIYPISIYLRRKYPEWNCLQRYRGIELAGKTLSLIGLGNIGRRVAKLAAAFEMEIVGFDPYLKPEDAPEGIKLVSTMEEALQAGDFVSIHVAGCEETRKLIAAEQLKLMKPSAILVNTTRGFVIDEAALIEALENGIIAGAALDVFEDEPLQPGNPLMLMENVIATPHHSANTHDAKTRAQAMCAENIISFFAGRPMPSALNSIDLV